MSDLLLLQADFAAALRDRGHTAAAGRWLAGDADHIERRLAIHRANIAAAADKALSAAYPVIRQVMGVEFCHDLAREFQRDHPSVRGDLTVYGKGLADFLGAFEPARSLPWLPDLARLEWAVHQAYGAADAGDWDPAGLAVVEPAQQEAIRLQWAPGLAVVASAFPIVRVWTLHQPAREGDFSVDWTRAEAALVARDGFAVTVDACGTGDAEFIAASLRGERLGDAAAQALARQAGFDLGALLARAFSRRLIVGFSL